MSTVPAPPPPHHCRTCGKVLNSSVSRDRVRWFHGIPADHPVDPVPTMEEPDRRLMLCDFCGTPNPTWGYRSVDFAMGGVERQRAGENWSACDTCADLIDGDQWSLLADRAADAYVAKRGLPRGAIRRAAASLHGQFRHAKTSGRTPIGEMDP